MMDCVEVSVEKREYVKHGVHKGMQGWTCRDKRSLGYWLVNFPQYGDKDDIAAISIKEEDVKEISVMGARINEQIKARFENSENAVKASDDEPLS